MTGPPTFDELVSHIEQRTAMMLTAISLGDGRVRERPGRTLRDLMFHVGTMQRAWAEAIPGWAVPESIYAADTANEGGLYRWLQRSTFLLAHALRSAGPDVATRRRATPSGRSMSARHVARRQLQEATVHAYDAQLSIGRPEPVPDDIAINGIDEFVRHRLAGQGAWPLPPAQIELRASMTPVEAGGGRVRRDPPMLWLLDLTASGVQVIPRETGKPIATMSGRAGDLLLALYGRTPHLAIDTSGDEEVIQELLDRTDASCSFSVVPR